MLSLGSTSVAKVIQEGSVSGLFLSNTLVSVWKQIIYLSAPTITVPTSVSEASVSTKYLEYISVLELVETWKSVATWPEFVDEKVRPWPLTTPLFALAVKRIPAPSVSKFIFMRFSSGPATENFEPLISAERASAPERTLVPTLTLVP